MMLAIEIRQGCHNTCKANMGHLRKMCMLVAEESSENMSIVLCKRHTYERGTFATEGNKGSG